MRAALQRWLWLVIVLPAGAMLADEAEHGLPQGAVKLGYGGGFITNSMLVCWLVAIGLIIFARVASRGNIRTLRAMWRTWKQGYEES